MLCGIKVSCGSQLLVRDLLTNVMYVPALSEDELAELRRIAANSAASIIEHQDIDMADYANAIGGHEPVSISHAGGELGAMAEAVLPM